MPLVILTSCSSFRTIRIPRKGPWHSANERPYVDRRILYRPQMHYRYSAVGYASWYSSGQNTAMGTKFNCNQLSAAHRTLPLPCVARVTNLENGKSIKVLVNDRGPFFKPKGRIIDVSSEVAKLLGGYNKGVFRVQVTCLPEESRIAALLKRRKPYPRYPGQSVGAGYYKLQHRIPYIPVLNEKGSRVKVNFKSPIRIIQPSVTIQPIKPALKEKLPIPRQPKTELDEFLNRI